MWLYYVKWFDEFKLLLVLTRVWLVHCSGLKYVFYLKGTYYANNTFPAIWGLWCSHTHTNFDFFKWDMHFCKCRLQLPTERVTFGDPFYVGRGHIWILPPTSPPSSNQSIGMILWTSGRAAPAAGARQLPCSSAPGVQSLSPPCRGSIWTSESQGQSSFPPILLNHGRDNPHYESLLVVEVPETSDAFFMIHNIIRRRT